MQLLPVIKENQLMIRPAKIGGFNFSFTVTDQDTQQPLPGVTVQLLDMNGQNILSYNDFTGTDNSGQLYLSDIPTDQDYRLLFIKNGYENFISKVADYLGYSDWTISLKKKSGSGLLLTAGIGAGLILLAYSNKKKVSGIETKDIINGALIIGGGYVLFTSMHLVDGILQFLGLQDSKQTQGLDYANSDPGSFWNPNFWMQFPNFTYAINEQQAINLIDQIKTAFGWLNDDESAVTSVFKQLKTQSNLSYLAYVFNQTEGQDLLTWLRGSNWPNDRLSDSEVYSIHQYFTKLPTH